MQIQLMAPSRAKNQNMEYYFSDFAFEENQWNNECNCADYFKLFRDWF